MANHYSTEKLFLERAELEKKIQLIQQEPEHARSKKNRKTELRTYITCYTYIKIKQFLTHTDYLKKNKYVR